MRNKFITNCPQCESENIYAITRVTGYFSKTSMWNKGKLSELKDRKRTTQDDWKYKGLDKK